MKIRQWEHSEKGVTDGPTDGRIDRTIHRGAGLQLKTQYQYYSRDHTNVLVLYIINGAFKESEIERIVHRLKNDKSPGCDNIPPEFLQ